MSDHSDDDSSTLSTSTDSGDADSLGKQPHEIPVPDQQAPVDTEPKMPSITHEVPVYWAQPADDKLAHTDFVALIKKADGTDTIDLKDAAGCPAMDMAGPIDAATIARDEGLVHRVSRIEIDTSLPTTKPHDIDQLDLHSLLDLHEQLETERKQLPVDLIVPGRLKGVALNMLVDSGSTISIISRSLWRALQRDYPELSLLPTAARIRTASGEEVPAVGRVAMDVELAGRHYMSLFYVLDSAETIILGMDFLARYEAECDWKRGILRLRGEEMLAHKQYSTGDNKVRRLTLVERTVLPARTQCIVQARVNKRFPGDLPDWGVTSPALAPAKKHGVMVGRAVVDGHAEKILLPMINPTDTTIVLQSRYMIGFMTPAEFVAPLPEDIQACHQHQTEPNVTKLDTSSESENSVDSAKSTDKLCSAIELLDQGYNPDSPPAQQEFQPYDRDDLISDSEETEPETPDQPGMLLGQKLGVPEHLVQLFADSISLLETEAETEQWAQFLSEYADVFAKTGDDLGRTSLVQHTIDTGAHLPVKQQARRVPIHKRALVQSEIDKMLRKGVIEPCDGPWASPIVLVTKKSGDTRFCVDFRQLNKLTKKDAYPLPRIEDNLESLQGAKWFSTLDLLSGFWQVEVAPEDRDKTAFSVGGMGHYRFVAMPFGLCNAPATFERLMERALAGLQWSIAVLYIDDVIVFSPDLQTHLERLGTVLTRLRKAGLKLKPSKCQLLKHKVEFLGHIVSAKGIEVDPEKVAKVAQWQRPPNLTNLRSFLGLCAYYKKFIFEYSTQAKPLFYLLEKDREFEWTSWHQQAFDDLKHALTHAPILAYPRHDCSFTLDTDASNVGIGAVLSQTQDGEERVIQYASRTLNKAERNYCVTRRELLAVVSFVWYFRHYLSGAHFTLRTDHAALYWLLRKRDPEGQVARWVVILQGFDMCLEHRPGRKHGNADALSRCMEGCKDIVDLAIPIGTKTTLSELQNSAVESLRAVRTRAQTRLDNKQLLLEDTQGLDKLFGDVLEVETDPQPPAWTPEPANKIKQAQIPEAIGPVAAQAHEPDTEVDSAQNTEPETLVESDNGTRTPSEVGTLPDPDNTSVQAQDSPEPRPRPPRSQNLEDLTNKDRMQQFFKEQPPVDWSAEAISFIQQQDPDLKVVRGWLARKETPTWKEVVQESQGVKTWWGRLELLLLSDNGVLYIRWHSGKHDPTPKYRVVACPAMLPSIMQELHDSKTAGHLGQVKTAARVKQSQFYFPGLSEYARRWVKNCNVCGARKSPQNRKRSPLQDYHCGATSDQYSCDLCGPFSPPTHSGSRWIFTITDWYTRFTQAYALKVATAENVAKCVVDFICLFGPCLSLYSDNGKNIDGKVMRQVCKLLGIKKLHTVPYRPSSNGLTERLNRLIKSILGSFVGRRARDWDDTLAAAMLAYRSSVHVALGETPNFMMFARELRLPVDCLIPCPSELDKQILPASQYVVNLEGAMRDAHAAVTEHLGYYYRYQKKNYDRFVKPQQFKRGDKVWLRIYPKPQGQSQAFLKFWDETWIVLEQISKVHYVIQKTPYSQARVMHGDRLKPHPGPIRNAATYRYWLALQPTADKVDRLAVEPVLMARTWWECL